MSALGTYLEGRDDIPNRDSILFAHRQDMEEAQRTAELERDQQKWAANERLSTQALEAAVREWRDTEDAKRSRIDHDGQLEINRSHANGRLRSMIPDPTP